MNREYTTFRIVEFFEFSELLESQGFEAWTRRWAQALRAAVMLR
jgi:hypothetical protein